MIIIATIDSGEFYDKFKKLEKVLRDGFGYVEVTEILDVYNIKMRI